MRLLNNIDLQQGENMKKVIVYIGLTPDFKEQVNEVMDTAIKKVVERNQTIKLDQEDIDRIKTLSIDQVNVDVSHRGKLKSMWSFNTESTVPILLQLNNKVSGSLESLIEDESAKHYSKKQNSDWEIVPNGEESVSKPEFEKEVLKMLLDDFSTAAFYGAFSYTN